MESSASEFVRAPICNRASMQQVTIDEAVPALRYFGIQERDPSIGVRTRKLFNCGEMNRLHEDRGSDFQPCERG